MKGIKKFFDYIVYCHIWLSLSIVILAFQNIRSVSYTHWDDATQYYCFLFFSCMSLYNIHWSWGIKTIDGQEKTFFTYYNKAILRTITIISVIISFIFFLVYYLNHWYLFLLPLVISGLYVSKKIFPRDKAIHKKSYFPKTFYVSFVIAYLTCFIPFALQQGFSFVNYFKSLEHSSSSPSFIFFIQHFFFIYAITFFFDLRDGYNDRKHGIIHLPNLLQRGSKWIYYALIYCLLIVSTYHSYQTCNIGFIPLSLIWFSLITLLFLPFLYNKNVHDYWLYAFLDGLIMLGGLGFILDDFL